MIHIDIFIAIYHYNDKSSIRYEVTEKNFKHYINIKNKFADRAKFTFTIVGSEKEHSKELTLKYFNEDEYFEFDQEDSKYENNFWAMFTAKLKYGMKQSSSKNADICLWVGSNDIFNFDFFEQIINYYNPNKPQVYGIDNFYNGNNAICFFIYNKQFVDITNDNDPNIFWWDGVSDYCGRKRFKYAAGGIGINKKLYNNHNIIDRWHYDEGLVEEMCLKIPEIDKFQSNKVFYFNIKFNGKLELTSFEKLRHNSHHNIIKFNSIDSMMSDKIKQFYEYFNNL